MFNDNKFMQIMKFFPQEIFKASVLKHNGDKKRRKFTCQNQLMAMIFCQLNGCKSLRELTYSFNATPKSDYHMNSTQIKRSTLSDANSEMNPEIFIDTLRHMMKTVSPKVRADFGAIINIIDSSPVSLKGGRFDDWTEDDKTSRTQGLKLHLGINPDSGGLTEFDISAPNKNDISVARNWEIKKEQIYIFDKGYYDYNWWNEITENGSDFVTRAKKNAAIQAIETFESRGENIISDEKVEFKIRSPRGGKKNLYIKPLRRITVLRENKKTPLVLLTSNFDLTAEEVANMYKERWQIELFFKWIKQKLRIKRFIGNTRNSVIIQLVTALITYLLLLIYKKACRAKCSLSEFLIEVKATLFHKNSHRQHMKKRRKNNELHDIQGSFMYNEIPTGQ